MKLALAGHTVLDGPPPDLPLAPPHDRPVRGVPMVFRSPDGRCEARFSLLPTPGFNSPMEFELTLRDSGAPRAVKGRFQHPYRYQPWMPDGRHLLLAPWRSGPIVLDVESQAVHALPMANPKHRELGVMVCAPRAPLAFVAPDGDDRGSFFDVESRSRLASIDTSHAGYSAWHERGYLLTLAQAPRTSVLRLRLHDPQRAEPLAVLEVDLNALLPIGLSEAELADVGGLRVPTDHRPDMDTTFGGNRALLEGFSDAHFAPPDRLYLKVYRPTRKFPEPPAWSRWLMGLARLVGSGYVYPARPHWIGLRLELPT